ncbi:MAG: hypothetical protein LRZ84_17450 [Desertifilum sp.]|nr:hypothetical protein [Desertifilum sp.]
MSPFTHLLESNIEGKAVTNIVEEEDVGDDMIVEALQPVRSPAASPQPAPPSPIVPLTACTSFNDWWWFEFLSFS